MLKVYEKFDDRHTNWFTGRRESPPMEERRLCACCGQRLVKGAVLSNGDNVGDDCSDIIDRAQMRRISFPATTMDEYTGVYHRSTGWKFKRPVVAYLAAHVFS